jgi:hypothetical protein
VAVHFWRTTLGILFGSIVAAGLSGLVCKLQSHNVRTELSGLQAYQAQAFHHQITVMNSLTKIYLMTDLIGHPSHQPCEICDSYKSAVYAEVDKIRKSVYRSVEILMGSEEDFDIPQELKNDATRNKQLAEKEKVKAHTNRG